MTYGSRFSKKKILCEIVFLYKAGVKFPAGTFLHSAASRPVLGPIQSPIQWILGAISQGITRPRREYNHSLHLVPRLRIVELHLHSPYAFMA
jgi:hypothetical protein